MMLGSCRFDGHRIKCVVWSSTNCIWRSCSLPEWLQHLPVWPNWSRHVRPLCLALWRPMPVACPWTMVGWWYYQGVCHADASSPLPTGSLTAWIWARFMARQMMSFRWQWRCSLGALFLHDKPCRPTLRVDWLATCVFRGSHALRPSLWATATLTSYYYYYYY